MELISLYLLLLNLNLLAPSDIFVLLLSNLITYFLTRLDKKNSYHLLFLILHMGALLLVALSYKWLLYTGENSYFSLVIFFRALGMLFLYLHISAAIRGVRPQIKWYYIMPIVVFLAQQLLNGAGFYLIPSPSVQSQYLMLDISEGFGFGGQGVSYLILTLYYLVLIVLDFIRYQAASQSIIKKKLFAFWLFGYGFILLLSPLFACLYFYSITDLGLFNLQNKHLLFFAPLTMFFFFLNPGFLYYFKVFKTVGVVNLAQQQSLFEEISELVVQDQLYLKPDFSFNELMFTLGQPAESVRTAIKMGAQKSFTDFVNGFRVQQSIDLMTAQYLELHSFDSLGTAAGFNSQQSFYRAFRKVHGQTPGEYWKTKNPQA